MKDNTIICIGRNAAISARTVNLPGIEQFIALKISGLHGGYSYKLSLSKEDALALVDLLGEVAMQIYESDSVIA